MNKLNKALKRVHLTWLSRVNMNTNSDKEDGNKSKEDNGMNKYRNPTCLHIAKLNNSPFSRQLE